MEEQDGQPVPRRLVGIDLGIASRHSVRVLEADGQVVCRSSCVPTVESLTAVERAALAGAAEGRGWRWCSSRRGRRGCRSRCSSPAGVIACSGCHQRRLRTCAGSCAGTRKSNGIDAETLARMPLADPGGLQQLELPGPQAAALDRRVRACERLTRAGSEHKVRIKDLVRQLMPMSAAPRRAILRRKNAARRPGGSCPSRSRSWPT
jgi:hypothetical protein